LFLFNEVKKSHYEILGVAKTAGDAEIKRAYFSRVRTYQPDRFPEEFKEIRAAYETLRDGEKRAEYDAIGELPPSVAPLFHEAQRFDRFGRRDKAAELYQIILGRHPELDAVRERYALSLSEDDKTGKAVEVWEALRGRQPGNPRYARELGRSYLRRGWNKKALEEVRRALALDRASIDGWLLLISCAIEQSKDKTNLWKEIKTISREALEAVRAVKVNEWEKIPLYTHAFVSGGIEELDEVRGYLREIIRLVREGGRSGREEGQDALKEILRLVPGEGLAACYPELKELADLFPGMEDLEALEAARLNFQIGGLEKKGFSELFHDLLITLNADTMDEDDELEVAAMEYIILDESSTYNPQLRRLKEEFPELYGLHRSFFNEALRTRDPEKMLYQRSKKIKRLKRQTGLYDEDPESAPPEPVRRAQPKVGRNDPCPCGSGKKYKRCCGA
jgi:tetratricopeptide (TPR) repeat protein